MVRHTFRSMAVGWGRIENDLLFYHKIGFSTNDSLKCGGAVAFHPKGV